MYGGYCSPCVCVCVCVCACVHINCVYWGKVEACVIHAVGSHSAQTGLTTTIAQALVGCALIRESKLINVVLLVLSYNL